MSVVDGFDEAMKILAKMKRGEVEGVALGLATLCAALIPQHCGENTLAVIKRAAAKPKPKAKR